MENKELLVIHGKNSSCIVTLNGIPSSEKLTPKMAACAARIGCGHRNGVTVQDTKNKRGYRLYTNSARFLHFE